MGGSSAAALSEFSRTVDLASLGGETTVERIQASPAERALVAERLSLLGLERLQAECRVKIGLAGLILVRCEWEADLAQACVVTLEPVRSQLSGRFSASFLADSPEATAGKEVLIDPEAEDPPEALPPEGIDLGELVVQELAVSLDPYPRREGADLPSRFGPPEGEDKANPFAALAVLKSKE